MPQSFIGQGWGFPLHTDNTGSIALSSGDREIAEAVRIILSTSPGERPMRPNFGCRIHDRIFGTADGNTIAQIKLDVWDALQFWEPRIDVQAVTVTLEEDSRQNQLFFIDVLYAVKGTNDRRNLVFPFYMIPEE
jgi:phage baseplate assembly protein W